MKLALSMLCENPRRRTGLTTLFQEFVGRSLKLFPDVSWLLFAGPGQEWPIDDPRIEVCRQFPANDHLNRRLIADHFQVPVVAKQRGADALLTVGFVPARKCLPTVMHVLSLQHLDPNNRVGFARGIYRHWVMKHSWPKADLVITNSKFAVSQILSVHPDFKDRLIQSYEGLQHEQFSPDSDPTEVKRLEAKFGIKPGYFLWISNFYPYKQAALLIDGYALLSPELRRQHPLVMVGASWEGELEAAQAQTEKLGLTNDIHFLKWIGDEWLAPLYRHGVAFCLASREETFGRCVIEAMACGMPCLVNDIPIMREIVGDQSLVIDYRDPKLVANGLTRLANDQVYHDQLRTAGLKHVPKFTFERLVTERISAIQQFLSSRTVG